MANMSVTVSKCWIESGGGNTPKDAFLTIIPEATFF